MRPHTAHPLHDIRTPETLSITGMFLARTPTMNNATLLAVLCCAPAAIAQLPPYQATDLGSPVGQSPNAGVLARGLSADGRYVAGVSVWEPFVWEKGYGMRALATPAGFVNSSAMDVDSLGLAVGFSGLTDVRATVWDAVGNPVVLHRSGWVSGSAVATNDAGAVLVQARLPNGFYTIPRVYLTDRAGSAFFDPAPNAGATGAVDLNESGQVLLEIDGTLNLYTPGLGTIPLPGLTGARMNDFGQVGANDGAGLVRWTYGITEQLGSAPRGGFRTVGAIDSFGQVGATEWIRTGTSPPSYTKIAWIYTDGLGLRRVDSLVAQPPSVFGYEVAGICDDGTIAISGSYGSDNRAIVLEPRFVSVYGSGCADGRGILPKANVAGSPDAGQRIVFLGAGALPSGPAAFFVSGAQASTPLPGGCTAWIDVTASVVIPVIANAAGQAHVPLTLPWNIPAGPVFAQFLSVDAAAPNGAFAVSNGVRIDVQ